MKPNSWSARSSRILRLAAPSAALVLTTMLGGPVLAQEAGKSSTKKAPAAEANPGPQRRPAKTKNDVAALHTEAAGLRQQIASVHEKAMEKDASLAARQQKILGAIRARMKTAGSDPAQVEKKAKALQARAENQTLSKEARQKAMKELMQIMSQFEQARHSALEDPKIEAMVRSFQADLLTAMKKVDPKVVSLIQKLRDAEQRLQEAQAEAS